MGHPGLMVGYGRFSIPSIIIIVVRCHSVFQKITANFYETVSTCWQVR